MSGNLSNLCELSAITCNFTKSEWKMLYFYFKWTYIFTANRYCANRSAIGIVPKQRTMPKIIIIPFAWKPLTIALNWLTVHADYVGKIVVATKEVSLIPCVCSHSGVFAKYINLSSSSFCVHMCANINMYRMATKCPNRMCSSYRFDPVCASNAPKINVHLICSIAIKPRAKQVLNICNKREMMIHTQFLTISDYYMALMRFCSNIIEINVLVDAILPIVPL